MIDETRRYLLRVDLDRIDEKAERAAAVWREDVSTLVRAAAEEWGDANHSKDDKEHWNTVLLPALLWRFHKHLAREMELVAAGWEQVFRTGLDEEQS